MKNKFIVVLTVLILIPVFYYILNPYLNKNEYEVYPHKVANDMVWHTTSRIEEAFIKSVEEQNIESFYLRQLLTLYGSMNTQLSSLLGEETYPRQGNGYAVNSYLLSIENKELDKSDWQIIEQLSEDYKKLDFAQSQLVDREGNVHTDIIKELIDLNNQIIQTVNPTK
ncbi:hypothetical protein [Marinicrinis sediminis]|uniref:DUF4825 domain-containing protein n=1 Tax=Marinicrinis sediminis TaxID=1652465 RepID=A0ABW5R8Q8_9BACL